MVHGHVVSSLIAALAIGAGTVLPPAEALAAKYGLRVAVMDYSSKNGALASVVSYLSDAGIKVDKTAVLKGKVPKSGLYFKAEAYDLAERIYNLLPGEFEIGVVTWESQFDLVVTLGRNVDLTGPKPSTPRVLPPKAALFGEGASRSRPAGPSMDPPDADPPRGGGQAMGLAYLHGGLLLGFHSSTSALQDAFGGGLTLGLFGDYDLLTWSRLRTRFGWFSKTVSTQAGQDVAIRTIPIEASLLTEPWRGSWPYEPYVGVGLGLSLVSLTPDVVEVNELAAKGGKASEASDSSHIEFAYHALVGAHFEVTRKLPRLRALVEIRYSSTPFFEDRYVNLDAGGVDFLVGARY
ncbi:MAG: LytR C-terminal domain-containing protein [Nitrospirae bacterium]|nr:LytR C-terminal domain-containing protein [Nitrospirota bacterium]